MSRRVFEKLAKAIRETSELTGLTEYQHKLMAQAIADVCESENSRFDYHRFLAACGISK